MAGSKTLPVSVVGVAQLESTLHFQPVAPPVHVGVLPPLLLPPRLSPLLAPVPLELLWAEPSSPPPPLELVDPLEEPDDGKPEPDLPLQPPVADTNPISTHASATTSGWPTRTISDLLQ